MIRILIGRDGREVHALVVTGHGGGPEGADVPCAAVSALAATLELHLRKHGTPCVHHEGADAFFGCAPLRGQASSAVVHAIADGLAEIAAAAPEAVQCVTVRCRRDVRSVNVAERVREFMARCRGALEASA